MQTAFKSKIQALSWHISTDSQSCYHHIQVVTINATAKNVSLIQHSFCELYQVFLLTLYALIGFI